MVRQSKPGQIKSPAIKPKIKLPKKPKREPLRLHDGRVLQNKVGCPPVYHPVDTPVLARNMMLLANCTDERLADLLGITVECIYKWCNEYPEFIQAINDGRDRADAQVVRSLFQRAVGYTHDDVHVSSFQGEVTLTPIKKHYPPDVGAIQMYLANRTRRRPEEERWRVNQNIELTGRDGKALQQTTINQCIIILPQKQMADQLDNQQVIDI